MGEIIVIVVFSILTWEGLRKIVGHLKWRYGKTNYEPEREKEEK